MSNKHCKIGDIHGHADELVALLKTLGYQKVQGVYRRPEREVIFLGDFIDRGPKIRQVLEIVRPMIEEETALAVMGNHELNALAYHTEDQESPGEFLRRRNPKNEALHRQTIEQLTPQELRAYLDWFCTLPLWLELDRLRVVHACWDERAMAQIVATVGARRSLTPALLQSICRKGTALFDSVEVVLKGKEAALPGGLNSKTGKATYAPKFGPAGTCRRNATHTERTRCNPTRSPAMRRLRRP